MTYWQPPKAIAGRTLRVALWRVWLVVGLVALVPLYAWALVNQRIESVA